jgi:uncharacterized membrane protein
MRKSWWVMTILACMVAGYGIVQYLIIGAEQAGFVQSKLSEFNIHLSSLWYVVLTIHVISSVIALIIGPFTLSKSFREKSLKRHRTLGRVYLLSILFGGGSGFYLAFYATGGVISTLGFGSLSILWWVSAYLALQNIKRKRIKVHREWMIRNYSLTFAAVTLRLWLALFVVLFGVDSFGTSYTIISWLSWVPNLIVAEYWVRSSRAKAHRFPNYSV